MSKRRHNDYHRNLQGKSYLGNTSQQSEADLSILRYLRNKVSIEYCISVLCQGLPNIKALMEILQSVSFTRLKLRKYLTQASLCTSNSRYTVIGMVLSYDTELWTVGKEVKWC